MASNNLDQVKRDLQKNLAKLKEVQTAKRRAEDKKKEIALELRRAENAYNVQKQKDTDIDQEINRFVHEEDQLEGAIQTLEHDIAHMQQELERAGRR